MHARTEFNLAEHSSRQTTENQNTKIKRKLHTRSRHTTHGQCTYVIGKMLYPVYSNIMTKCDNAMKIMTLVKYTVTVQPFCDNWQTSENAIEVATVKRKQRSLRTSCKTARDGSVLGNDGDSSTQIKMCGPPRWCIKLWDITHRECASCGILWCRRTPQCRRRANRRVSGYIPLDRSCAATNASKLLFHLQFCLTTYTWIEGALCVQCRFFVSVIAWYSTSAEIWINFWTGMHTPFTD